MYTIDISSIDKHDAAAKQLLEFANQERVFLFDAPMGSGKTTFIKSLCKYLGVQDSMSSPTYSIVNEYHTQSNKKIYHFDLYRIKNPMELMNIGIEDYLSDDNYKFIEWSDLSVPFLTSYVRIIINVDGNNRYLRAEIIK